MKRGCGATRQGICGRWPAARPLLLALLVRAAELAPADPDVPDLDQLLRRALENAQRDREMEARFKARYAYVRTRITDTLNAEGEVKKRDHQRLEHTPARPEPDPWTATDDDRPRAYERRDVPVTTNLLARFRFSLVGREAPAGRPAWVVDFAPAGDRLPADSLIERFINRMAGRLWIDAAEQHVVRAQFHLTGPVHVVGGLVGALRHCEVFFERARTEEGFWFTRLLTWRIEGRKLFARRLMTHHEELTDVRRVAAAQAPEPVARSPSGPAGQRVPRRSAARRPGEAVAGKWLRSPPGSVRPARASANCRTSRSGRCR